VRFLSVVAAAALATTLAGGCGRAAPRRPAAVATITPDQVRASLTDSWVSDGRRGYFVDNAHSAAHPPFDLYQTYWRLRLAQWSGHAGDGVSAGAVQAWTGGALTGDLAVSGLPAIAQIDYAIRMLGLLHGKADASRVAKAVERLRSGGLYRIDATAAPDWGATALAVDVLTRIGAQVPAPVLAAVRAALGGPPPGGGLPQLVALLRTAGELGPRATGSVPATVLEGLVHTAYVTLSDAAPKADAVWLTQQDDLRTTAKLLGLTMPAVAAQSCDRLVGADGGVRLPGQPGPDPQATLAALEAGCRTARVPADTAHAPGGWPNREAVADAVRASTAGMRVAREAGVTGRFAAPLRRQVAEVWAPANRGPAATPGTRVERTNLRILAGLLGGAAASAVVRALPAPALGGDGDFAMLGYLLDLTYPSPSRPEQARAKATVLSRAAGNGSPSMIRAAWLESAARMFAEPALHQRALAVVRSLRPATPAGGGLTDVAIGSWVARTAPTPAPAQGAGAPLADLAVVLAVRHGAFDELFPVAL
jgi:hypothetical protein